MRKNQHTAQITTLGTQQLHAKGKPVPLTTVRIFAPPSFHLTSHHHTSPYHSSLSTSQQHSTSFHQIPQSSESWGCTRIHLILSTFIILVVAIIKNIHPSFHIPHPTQIQLASRKKNPQSKAVEPAKQTPPRSSPLPCMHNTFHPPNPPTQLQEPPPHLQPVHHLPPAERRRGNSV